MGTGSLGSRVWSGPAITVIGIDVPSVDNALNAVSPYARAKLNVRVHPSRTPQEAQAAVVEHLRQAMPFGLQLDVEALETGHGFAAQTDSPAVGAASAAWSAAWGAETVMAGGGGSIPLVSSLAEAVPRREILLGGDDGRLRQHPRARTSASCSTSSRRPTLAIADLFGRLGRAASVSGAERRGRRARPGVVAARLLDLIERVGNKVPHPAIMFLALCIGVILLSQVLAWVGRLSATYEVVKPPAAEVEPSHVAGSTLPGRDAAGRAAGRRRLRGRRPRPSRSRACSPPTASATCSPRSCPTSWASPRWGSSSSS